MHLACTDPPLASIPEGDWFCAACSRGAGLMIFVFTRQVKAFHTVCLPLYCVATLMKDGAKKEQIHIQYVQKLAHQELDRHMSCMHTLQRATTGRL